MLHLLNLNTFYYDKRYENIDDIIDIDESEFCNLSLKKQIGCSVGSGSVGLFLKHNKMGYGCYFHNKIKDKSYCTCSICDYKNMYIKKLKLLDISK